MLGGGLHAANVGDALRAIPALGVDVASGVERRARDGSIARDRRDGRPRKDPVRVGLFVKRAKAARLDRPQSGARLTPVHRGLLDVDDHGRWGPEGEFGGRYVPETLVGALIDLERAWDALRDDPRYWAIDPSVVAAEVLHAIDQPWGVTISDVTVRATGEDFVL